MAQDILNKSGRNPNKELGASLVEYGLLVALIAVLCVAGLQHLGTKISLKFNTASTAIGTGQVGVPDEGGSPP